jgi:hypothetical protein
MPFLPSCRDIANLFSANLTPSKVDQEANYKQMLRDLDRLQQARLRHHSADWLLRTDATPMIAALFRHAHIALPPRARQTAPPKAALSRERRIHCG